MATIKLQGNASGSGSVTLTAPNTNSARTITLPDEDVDLGSLGGAGSIVAWGNWTQVGTHTLYNSGNVSSLTDGGVGITTANFSNSLSASTYSLGVAAGAASNDPYRTMGVYTGKTTSSVQTATVYYGNSRYDGVYNSITVVL